MIWIHTGSFGLFIRGLESHFNHKQTCYISGIIALEWIPAKLQGYCGPRPPLQPPSANALCACSVQLLIPHCPHSHCPKPTHKIAIPTYIFSGLKFIKQMKGYSSLEMNCFSSSSSISSNFKAANSSQKEQMSGEIVILIKRWIIVYLQFPEMVCKW